MKKKSQCVWVGREGSDQRVTGEIAKQVNQLLCKHKDQDSEPLNPHKSQAGREWPTCNPTAGEEETDPPEKAGRPD